MKHIRWSLFFVGLLAFTQQSHGATPVSESNTEVSISQEIIPVLALKSYNPILKVDFKLARPTMIKELVLSFDGTTDVQDISKVEITGVNKAGNIEPRNIIASYDDVIRSKKSVVFKNNTLPEDSIFYISVTLNDKVDLANVIRCEVDKIVTDLGRVDLRNAPEAKSLKTGVAVHIQNWNNVHTARIPGLSTSKDGTLIALYDARIDTGRDLQGDIDIAVHYSYDGGMSWSERQTVLDMGEWGGLPEKYNGVSDGCVLVDDNTGDIYIAGLWMHGVLDVHTGVWAEGLNEDSNKWTHQWAGKGSQPGFGVKQTSQFIITKSSDEGKTWSEPVNITESTKRKEWWLYAPAPGHGITLRDGTLVFPTQGRDKNGMAFSNITYSKDGGKTWTTSNPAYSNTTECMAVQLADGGIMLNMRDNRNRGVVSPNGRRICVTYDLGDTWTEHPTSAKVLTEPTCMASLHKHNYTKDGVERSVLVFMNPDNHASRRDITVKFSFDDGLTWPEKYWVLLDQGTGRGYSCVTSIDNDTIGVLYECSQADMAFQQIDISNY